MYVFILIYIRSRKWRSQSTNSKENRSAQTGAARRKPFRGKVPPLLEAEGLQLESVHVEQRSTHMGEDLSSLPPVLRHSQSPALFARCLPLTTKQWPFARSVLPGWTHCLEGESSWRTRHRDQKDLPSADRGLQVK